MSAIRMSLVGLGMLAGLTFQTSADADPIRDLDHQAARLQRQSVEMVRHLRWEVGECPQLEVLLRQADGLFCLSQEIQRDLLFFDGDPYRQKSIDQKLDRFQREALVMCATLDEVRARKRTGRVLHAQQHFGGHGWSIYFNHPFAKRPQHVTARPIVPVSVSVPLGALNSLHARVEDLSRTAARLQRDVCRL